MTSRFGLGRWAPSRRHIDIRLLALRTGAGGEDAAVEHCARGDLGVFPYDAVVKLRPVADACAGADGGGAGDLRAR